MRKLFLAIALGLFVVAAYFGNQVPFERVQGPAMMNNQQSVEAHVAVASNAVAGSASLGFALAGGLALIAAAIVREGS
jgi:hypothetical protein